MDVYNVVFCVDCLTYIIWFCIKKVFNCEYGWLQRESRILEEEKSILCAKGWFVVFS